MFSTPNRHVAILSLLVQKVMQKRQCFTLLLDMVQFGDFWSRKVMLRPLVLLSQIAFAHKSEICVFGKVDLRQENKGLEHHFLDKKSPNGTMLKSSVKHNGKCYAFLTKSDKSVHFSTFHTCTAF